MKQENRAPFSRGPTAAVPMEIDSFEIPINGVSFSNSPERLQEIRNMDKETRRKVCFAEDRCFYCKKHVGNPPEHTGYDCPAKAVNTTFKRYSTTLKFDFNSKLGTLSGTISGSPVSKILLDSGAGGEVFLDYKFAIERGIVVEKLLKPVYVSTVDGSAIGPGVALGITESINVEAAGYRTCTRALVLDIAKYPMILGISWLRKFNSPEKYPTGNS